jgi:thiamine pyrophosphate-dependent acetolactate synthase large subunit-like protein
MCVCEREREREKERERKREREREREKERERKREREREREKEREKLCMRLDEISALLTDSCLLSNAYHQPLQWACMHLNVYAWLRSLEFSLV